MLPFLRVLWINKRGFSPENFSENKSHRNKLIFNSLKNNSNIVVK